MYGNIGANPENHEYGENEQSAYGYICALKNAEPDNYICIVLDIRMDDVNGLDLCRLIRQKYRVPIIFLTSLTEEEIMIEGFECGGDDYLLKPYRMKELEMRVRR